MQSIPEVIKFLTEQLQYSLQRPKMYAPNPDALEVLLVFTDDLRISLVTGQGNSLHFDRGYWNYCRVRGWVCGARNFCSATRADRPGITDDELWTVIADSWKQYLRDEWQIEVKEWVAG